MPVYAYRCRNCAAKVEGERSIAERNNPGSCPACGTEELQIEIGAVHFSFTKTPRLTTEAQIEADYGKDWRETKGSRRMKRGEPEKIYSLPTSKI